jgi:hypothetical protein
MSISRDEVMRLMVELKRQLDSEVKRDLEALEQRLMRVIESTEKKTESRVDSIKTQTAGIISSELAKVNNAITQTNTQALANRQITRELVKKATEQMATQVYDRINGEIMPKVAQAQESLAYLREDGAEAVDAYRREVHRRHKFDSSQKMLTNGDSMKKIELGDHISLFWDGTDD